jgi:hypothetical protein
MRLAHRADVYAKGGHHSIAPPAASSGSHTGVVKMLLRVSSQDGMLRDHRLRLRSASQQSYIARQKMRSCSTWVRRQPRSLLGRTFPASVPLQSQLVTTNHENYQSFGGRCLVADLQDCPWSTTRVQDLFAPHNPRYLRVNTGQIRAKAQIELDGLVTVAQEETPPGNRVLIRHISKESLDQKMRVFL